MFNVEGSTSKTSLQDIRKIAIQTISDRLNQLDVNEECQNASIAWIDEVFKNSQALVEDESLELPAPDPIELPKEICAYTVQSIIRILTSLTDPHDNSLYFLNDIGQALGIQPKEMRNLLDKEFDKLRLEFTLQLKEELSEEKIYWCALILMKIICADGKIHPAEKTYFTVITELINGTEYSLESLEKTSQNITELPNLELSQQSARAMLKYVVTIAMCDGEYVGQESEFITQAAASLGIEASQIDGILQPVASSFMVLESLFPRKT